MAATIKTLTIEGYKSIRKLQDFPLRALNVLIGANGAGKSNFVSFFNLLRQMMEQRLQVALATTEGGADACLYLGPAITRSFDAKLYFGDNGYKFSLVPTSDNRLIFSEETTEYLGNERSLGSGHSEAKLYYVFNAISSWVVYHFHDTSLSASVRRPRAINDNAALRQN